LVSPVTPFQTVIGATSPGGEVSAVAFLPVAFVARAGKLLFDRSLYALAAWQVALPKLRFCKPCFSHFGCLLTALFGLVKMLGSDCRSLRFWSPLRKVEKGGCPRFSTPKKLVPDS
jgi:hypothetical protein